MIKRILLAAYLAIAGAVGSFAQAPNSGSGVPNTAPAYTCVAGTCTFLVLAGAYNFPGTDGTTQFATGSTASAAEYWQAIGAITTGGATFITRNAAQTGNVNGHFVAQGTGTIDFGSNGRGVLATTVDPGGPVGSPVQLTPGRAGLPAQVGNATLGVNLDCGTTPTCQRNGVDIGVHDVQFFAASGTWTAKAGITWVRAKGCGGGGGGGSGALEISGIVSSGGGGGGGGACFDETFRASDLGTSQTVAIGAGGASVAGQTTNTTAGLNGNAGGYTCLGGTNPSNSIDCGGGGGGGAGGQLAATASGGGGGAALNAVGGSSTNGTGGTGALGLAPTGGSGAAGASTSSVSFGAAGGGSTTAGAGTAGGGSVDACGAGGSGGGVAAAASNNGGGGGNAFRAYKQGAAPAGGTSGTPTGGSITPSVATLPGFGGGGGYGNFSGVAGAGGNGTQCGGGGGGGTALNGSTAGASGKGGDGWMVVTSW